MPHNAQSTTRRAFTLVELLVVIAVVAILIGVLLPALAGARSSGYQIKDASLQKQLMLGLHAFGNENDLQIPGLNTSGIKLRTIAVDKLDRASKPVQNFDWLSPSLDDATLPDDRSERFGFIFNEFVNPANSQTMTSGDVDYGTNSGDFQDYMEGTGQYNGKGARTISAPSYFMAASWQWAGPTAKGNDTDIVDQRYVQPAEEQDVVLLPAAWFPRINNVGGASGKAAISNAVLDNTSPKLPAEIWVVPDDSKYGAFCSSTPIRKDAKSFQVDTKEVSFDRSFPHSGKLNAGFWDGHVGTLGPQDCQDPGLWYPRGSIMTGDNATDPARNLYSTGDKIN